MININSLLKTNDTERLPVINMRSSATLVKGHGVASCYEEQVKLVTEGLSGHFKVVENSFRRCDIAHYHTVNPQYFFERLLNRRTTSGIGYVHFLPDTVDQSLRMPPVIRRMFYKYLLAFYNSMDYLVAVNPNVINKLENYGVTRPKFVYIPNYVSDCQFYEQDAGTIAGTRRKFGVPEDVFVVLGAGQLQTRKGIRDFVKTAGLLPHIQFVWAGGFSFGPLTEGYDEIRAIVARPPENVRFLGIVERKQMNAIYNMADLMFLPSYDELFPMTILEAMCCGKPIVLRDVDIYPKILFDSYIKGKSAEEFARRIEELRNDPAAMARWKEKIRGCHNLYSRDNILRIWESLYTEALQLNSVLEKV